ncbi:MAG: TonB family protein [Acidobacteria bacterium]|nr:TonB family protein [Acidobacteriota bacterium]
MADEIRHLLSDDYPEPEEPHGRDTFLVSVLTHIAIVMVLVAHPEMLFSPPKPVEMVRPEDAVQLVYQPPQKSREQLRAPPLPKPPAQPQAPVERAQQNPDAMREPPPAPREAEPPPERELLAENRGGGGGDRIIRGQQTPGIPNYPEEIKNPPKRPGFESVQLPPETPPSSLSLPPIGSASRGTDALLREMAKQRASGQGPGTGMGLPGVGKGASDPNFNLPGPQILSDTMGVDFNPYLLRVYLAVRRNWYAVIPEIARLGRKGRAVVQFHILRDGGVEQLVLEDGSGTTSLDSAALSSIRLSDPFPPLPSEFPGADIRLRFVYFYNLRME